MKKALKITGIIAGVLFTLFVLLVVLANTVWYTPPTHTIQQAAQVTTPPTVATTARPTSTPVIVPTATARPVIVPTHAPVLSNAQLGSTLASFKVKYGTDSPQSDSVTAFIASPGLQEGSLVVTTDASKRVINVVYSGPDGWNRAQYVEEMQSFMPVDAKVENVAMNTPELTAYTSASIGPFYLHILDGAGGISFNKV